MSTPATIKRIVLTGPESTGKTTLARRLAAYYGALSVPEYARAYLHGLGRPYQYEDLEQIALGQLALEQALEAQTRRYLFCDTGMLVLKVWAEYRFGRCPAVILDALATRPYDLYVLCGIDVPWEYDPLRENPLEREELYEIYRSELWRLQSPFLEVQGAPEERLRVVTRWLQDAEGR